MSRPVVVEGAAAAGGSANPVAATPGGAGGAETASPSNNNAGNTSSVPQRSIRKYAQWTEDMEECLMSQSYVEEVHTAPHGQKRKRFEAVTNKLNSLDEFIRVGGVAQSKMEEVYKRLMATHREKVANGDFDGGEGEGQPNAMRYVCNKLMEEEDEFQAKKSGKTDQVLDISSKSAGIRLRKKRVFGGGDGGSSAESHNGDTSVDLERALAEYLKSHTDDAETKERKLKIKENESRAAVLQAETFREIAIGSPSARKRKLEVDLMEAETRKLQAQNAKIQLDNQKKQLENQAEQAEQTNKLHHGFLAALERMSSSS